jgi:hypothetical protein
MVSTTPPVAKGVHACRWRSTFTLLSGPVEGVMIMGNERTRSPADAKPRDSRVGRDALPRAQGAATARKLLAQLGKFLSPREQHRAGVYLPLVRVDGNE